MPRTLEPPAVSGVPSVGRGREGAGPRAATELEHTFAEATDSQALGAPDASRAPGGASDVLRRALDIEVGKLELLRTRAWLALSGAITLGSMLVALQSSALGFIGVCFGALAGGWFAVVHRALQLGRWRSWHGWGTFVVEQGLPWGFTAAVAVTAGPVAALAGWGPPLIFGGVLVLSVLKLNRDYALLTGAVGGVAYIVASVLVVLPRLPEQPPLGVDVSLVGQVLRGMFLLLGGGVAAWVSAGLSNALGGVARSVRENDLFGKYRLLRPLGQGGMGEVWQATYCPEGGFQRPAAVKLVHAHLASQPEFINAFRSEAELSARLVHNHIAQVFDFGRVEDRWFLAMEHVDGVTLGELLRRAARAGRPLPAVVAGVIARGVLSALEFAHDEATAADGSLLRVVHRDVAPANVLIARSGTVKLTDFGIARALKSRAAEHTQTVAGHFSHMAPEQVQAGLLDGRTDLYCVGILLWEMLTLRPLFRRDTEAATLRAVLAGAVPPPSAVDPELAPWDVLCARALAADPDRRFQSANAMAQAVAELVGDAGEVVVARFLASLPEASVRVVADVDPSAAITRRLPLGGGPT